MEKVTRARNLGPRLTVRPLPLKKLAPLAEQLAATADDQQSEALRKEFLEGYYGRPVRLPNAKAAAV